jgi:hypothetical protein
MDVIRQATKNVSVQGFKVLTDNNLSVSIPLFQYPTPVVSTHLIAQAII